jgi:hypothetical protein
MPASFEELRRLAADGEVSLLHAYAIAGLADSTYYRHRDGRNGMTISSYNALRRAIETLGKKVAA